MLITYNICDYCGNQNEILKEDNQFVVEFKTCSAYDAAEGKNHYGNRESFSYCQLECMLNWFKQNFKQNGKKREELKK